MILLSIDTSASLCGAGLFDGERELGREVIDIGKGHAEHLMAVIEAALGKAGVSYPEIDRIAVAIGPGSFTGIRVGVATARGLALALKVPAVGVNNLEAAALEARERHAGRNLLVAFASSLGAIQGAVYDPSGAVLEAPAILTAERALELASRHAAVVTGSAAATLKTANPDLETDGLAVTADVATYAAIGATKAPGERPKPLYLREPDAKPQTRILVPRAN